MVLPRTWVSVLVPFWTHDGIPRSQGPLAIYKHFELDQGDAYDESHVRYARFHASCGRWLQESETVQHAAVGLERGVLFSARDCVVAQSTSAMRKGTGTRAHHSRRPQHTCDPSRHRLTIYSSNDASYRTGDVKIGQILQE